jgi:predicted transcriptional regulator
MDGQEEHTLASDLFTELGSEIRCSMLVSLNNGPAKLSSIARRLDITAQHAHQNLNRLCDAGLLERGEGTFHITEFGRMVTGLIPYFLFAKKHRAFFNDHTLAGIPEKFVQRIGALHDCKAVNSVTAVFQSLKKLQSSANESLKIIVAQAWPEEGEILIDRANHGIKISALVGHNTIFPRNVVEHIVPRINELIAKGIFERKMVEQVSVAIFIADDREAAIAFPNTKGEVDMNIMFVGENTMFCEWCSDYFDYMWKDSKPFNLSKIKVVEY